MSIFDKAPQKEDKKGIFGDNGEIVTDEQGNVLYKGEVEEKKGERNPEDWKSPFSKKEE